MSLLNWIFDIYQHSKIDEVHQEAARLRAEAQAMRDSRGGVDPDRLERAIGELALAVKTVRRAVVEKGLCTEAEFQRMMQRIDREDGAADGQAPVR